MFNYIENNYKTEGKRSLETIGKYLPGFLAKINYGMNVESVSLLHRNRRDIFLNI